MVSVPARRRASGVWPGVGSLRAAGLHAVFGGMIGIALYQRAETLPPWRQSQRTTIPMKSNEDLASRPCWKGRRFRELVLHGCTAIATRPCHLSATLIA